jgi:hypothetical protein
MSETITIEQAIFHFLHTVPETWTDYDPATLSALQERAVYVLTAAGMIERRVTLRLRMVGHPVAVEATITMTGEGGLAQAMGFVLTDIWSEWQEAFERHRSGDLKDQPFSHCERVGNEQWRLTAEGVLARNDLDAGNAATVYDFVLKRGFFSGQPRLMPGGRISQRLPVAGRGALERMRRVGGDAGPTVVAISNWDAGSKAFADAFEKMFAAQAPRMPGVVSGGPDIVPDPAPERTARSQPKRSTERGEGRAKLIATLTKHHQYADGGCLNQEPIGNNELAKAAGVSASRASAFFDEKFQGHANYKVMCRDVDKLTAALKLLNDEFAPFHLLGNFASNVVDTDDE